MKAIIKNLCGMLALSLALTACYDDEGNYTYHEINEVSVTIPKTSVRLPREGEVQVSITPELSQTMLDNEENLTFQWYKGSANATHISEDPDEERDMYYRPYSTDKVCTLTVAFDETAPIKLLLMVTDRTNNTQWYAESTVNMVLPFSHTWFVLQEEGGKGMLGAADGEGDQATIFRDIYAEEFDRTFPLEGKPLSLDAQHQYGPGSWNYGTYAQIGGMMYRISPFPALHIMTDQDLHLVAPSTLESKYTSAQMLLGAGQPLDLSAFYCGTWATVAISQGKVWQAREDSHAVYYTAKDPEGNQLTSTQWTEYGGEGSVSGYYWLTFDKPNHRFLTCSYTSMEIMMPMTNPSYSIRTMGTPWSDSAKESKSAFVPESTDATLVDVFDADGADLAGIDVFAMARTDNQAYAFATGGGSPVTIYEFSADATEAPCSGLYHLTLPDGLNPGDCRFISSKGYVRVLFMAAGNKVYKIDLNRGTPEAGLIYEYTADPAATVAAVKFKEQGYFTGNDVYTRHLGVAFNRADGTGSVVELHLTAAGDVDRAEGSVYEYAGYGKIVDIAYNYSD